jgi:transposase-like protein
MKPASCPFCDSLEKTGSYFVKFGFYFRTSDSKQIQRFLCMGCRKTCSHQSSHAWFRQKKRLKNSALRKHFASCGTMRRAAMSFNLNRKTVARKLLALGFEAESELARHNRSLPKATVIEFDDLETFEHTKCKPLSVTLAVESTSRRILGIEISSMPAKGKLAALARRKYGYRRDGRSQAREALFSRLKELVAEDAVIKSDSNPHYAVTVREHFPNAKHITYESRRGAIGGQGELKKLKFDPLFSLNHTCAMLRANVSRLVRRTWCTTKRVDRLRAHLMIYAQYHNDRLI